MDDLFSFGFLLSNSSVNSSSTVVFIVGVFDSLL